MRSGKGKTKITAMALFLAMMCGMGFVYYVAVGAVAQSLATM